jgi:probable F420-dependent oxidoreductase
MQPARRTAHQPSLVKDRREQMKIGAIYPQTELGGDPTALHAIGMAVEELGYDYLLMFDHVAGAVRVGRNFPMLGPYSDEDPFHDPLISFGYLAGITKRIGLATGILVLPQRQTLLVARQAADVDLLSGGRLRLGVGAGWNPVEFEALGQDFISRGRRLDEQIQLLRRLWNERPLSFEGRFDRIDRAGLNPLPGRTIPVWLGGSSEAAFRRAVRLGDGFIFSGSFEDRILPAWERMQLLLNEHGRAQEAFGAEYLLSEAVPATAAVRVFRRWQEVGGTHAAVRTMGHGFTNAEQHIDYLAEIRARLM